MATVILSAAHEAHMMVKAQRRVLDLFLRAAKRACGGKMPTKPEFEARSVVEDAADGSILVRWDGEPILSLSAGPGGLAYEFLGKAVPQGA